MNADTQLILKALLDIRRGQILAIKANPATEDLYTNAFVHAIMHSVCPIFDEEFGFAETESERLSLLPFYSSYDVPHNTVEKISNLLQKKRSKKEKLTFNDVEEPYTLGDEHWPGKDHRNDLINICRYFYLRKMFDAEFWEEFMSNAPTQASEITAKWNRTEIITWI